MPSSYQLDARCSLVLGQIARQPPAVFRVECPQTSHPQKTYDQSQ